MYGKVKDDVREIISTLCKYKDADIIAGAVCIDHVHLSVAITPFGASGNIALLRANIRPPFEMVVGNLNLFMLILE
ncbi:hypothetical protein LXJ15735_09620 [Lacrimispora xylanolytica]